MLSLRKIHLSQSQCWLTTPPPPQKKSNTVNLYFQMSAISVGCEEAYKTSVDVTCETVDSSIKVTRFYVAFLK